MIARGEVSRGMSENDEENIVNNSVINLHGDRWLLYLVW